MDKDFPLFPESASTVAQGVDSLYIALVIMTVVFTAAIALVVIYFALRYRRRSEQEQPAATRNNALLETLWIVIPFVIVMLIFLWGTQLYFANAKVPKNALPIYVVGKQWMWKIQHPEGQSEINELHVPVGQPVRLIMTSEDVIHSFFIPAFRIKQDVLPGRFTSAWFEATKPGRYHLFCAEYCGTEHSKMIGTVTVMTPSDYEAWLSGGRGGETMAAAGDRIFRERACATCHTSGDLARGPSLDALFGNPVLLADGRTVIADEAYLRRSILTPAADVVAGYSPIMPTYEGQLSEQDLMQLIVYIQSLAPQSGQE